ncbi:MAG: glycosyltransferase [Acetatifactor sp.]
MNDTPVLLSISMLISGRDEMKKSLDSLMCFKRAFSCEIILVDTGCTAEHRRLAEQYADKIIDFVWCDDFSAARNAGLREARGEWFMYLDDDEWFENPEQITAFFTTGEYKNYKSATYVVRNYKDLEGRTYNETYPSRMVKRLPQTRFVGKIHEYLEPYEGPQKEFTDYAHHYGYVFRSEEEKLRHSKRNIEPLCEMRKAHPGDPRWTCQLAQEYFQLHDFENMISTCKEGIEEWKRTKDHCLFVPAHAGGVYAYLMIALEALKRYDEEEVWLNRALSEPELQSELLQPTQAFFCLLGAKLYHNLKDNEKCCGYLQKYLDYEKRLKNNRVLLEKGAALIVAGVFQKPLLYDAVLNCMEAAVLTGNTALSEEAFYRLDWQSGDRINRLPWEEEILDAFCSVDYHPVWVKLLQTMVSGREGVKEMQVVLSNLESAYGIRKEDEKRARLHRLVSEMDDRYENVFRIKLVYGEASLRCHIRRCAGLEETEKAFWLYADWILKTYRPYIREEIFTRLPEVLPEEAYFAVRLKNLQQYRESGNDLKALESMKLCLGICPGLQKETDSYAKMLRDEVQRRNCETESAQAELQDLIITLKNLARQQIECGNCQGAKEILLQIRQCAPGDEEVGELLEQLS